ncbi:MAG TPA: PEP/pyruvate-binding domain-containing protein [Clostridiales bacterium]|nr:MAG: Phosphoenolpyruvate synthase [Firmicutes bacterium ADurb.Bin262]HOU09177.1 PEP/pyruvate-binding domain-containing protein [Clostridiales bacterium]HQK73036.1 PEP/pyruvate-binding domain-containing protein [Clostridiales bacterium]
MLIGLDHAAIPGTVGNKAALLMEMKQRGFNVPGGFVLDNASYREIAAFNRLEEPVRAILDSLGTEDLRGASARLTALFDGAVIPKNIADEIGALLQEGQKYAVRSSGLKEDLEAFSFAGQYRTLLNVSGKENVGAAVIDCYRSMFTEPVLSYIANHRIGFDRLEMAVVVQEMVEAEKSGVAFTVNPLTGNDKEIVLEVAEGTGENLVSGKVRPERYAYNWFEGKADYDRENRLLTAGELEDMARVLLDIQAYFGYPCDIEFAVRGGTFYILQSRPITKIMYAGIRDQWSTADFKDGGVSATVCTPFMWSLYEYIWETTLRKFLVESKLIKDKDIAKLGDMFYGRPYWNMTMVKKGMAAVPGYKERQFDSEFGVKITYEGDGETTKVTPGSLIKILRVALRQKKFLALQEQNVESLKDGLLQTYGQYVKDLPAPRTAREIRDKWLTLVRDDYLKSEGTYFWQIFLNTVHQAVFKDKILKYVDHAGYFRLIGGLENISHLLPFYDMWEMSRAIKADPAALTYWNESGAESIAEDLRRGAARPFLGEFSRLVEKYGYHSDKELDVTYPCFYEEPVSLVKMLKEYLPLDESRSPVHDIQKQKQAYLGELARLEQRAGKRKARKLRASVEKVRSMLWWREELRDVSTRFYYIIRMYTLELGGSYAEQGILEQTEDIWFLKIADLFAFAAGEKTADELKKLVRRNRTYYDSFRNFTGENEIGAVFDRAGTQEKDPGGDALSGIGCNAGTATGAARVIESLEEIDRLRPDDILVTRFTDTGWVSKFAILGGIVTEYGGILCHAAIVSREYGIPCVVCVPDAMKRIQDGSMITINGETGEIRLAGE